MDRRGKNFLLFDARAGLAVQRIQLAPNGNSDRRINKYSLTLWFRIPYLPSKAPKLLSWLSVSASRTGCSC